MHLFIVLVCAAYEVKQVTAQRRHILQDLINRIKSSPRHQSSSPSWFGERQFDVIGTGTLPLQSHREETRNDEIDRKFVDDSFEDFYIEEESKNSPPGAFPVQQASHRYQSLGQLSQDREFFQGFQPSVQGIRNQQFPVRPQASQYFLQNSEGASPYTGFQSDARRTFDENLNLYQREPDSLTYFGEAGFRQEPARRRSKRSPYKRIKIKIDNPFYFSNPRPRQNRRKDAGNRRQQNYQQQSSHYDSGPHGFWDDEDFDSNFFNGGHLDNPVHFDQEQHPGSRVEHEYQPDFNSWEEQSYPRGVERNEGENQYANVRNYLERERVNKILGSGNFIIEKGGTFYDDDEVPYTYSNPQYLSNNNFDNFRDFADIKGERLAGRRRFRY